MKNRFRALEADIFDAGDVVKVSSAGQTQLPNYIENISDDMLCLKTKEGYRLIPLLPDVKRIYIEVTTKCNFDCITCIRSSWRDCYSHMPYETYEKIIESLKELPHLESVHFGGFGEPMAHPRIFDMLKSIKDLGLKAEMITNGSYLTKENVHRLIDLKLDVLFTSIDSPEEDGYNEIRLGADFQSVAGNVAYLQEAKKQMKSSLPELGIEFVAMKKNFHQLPELAKLARVLEANQIIVSNLIPYHESMKDEIVYDLDDTVALFGNDSEKITMFAQISQMKLRTERYCKFVSDKTLSINYQGDVSPCYPLMHHYDCYIYGKEKEMFPVYFGNVNDTGLKEIWMKPRYVNFRRVIDENRYPSCLDCKYLDGCSYTDSNEIDCWGNSPSCGECLWSRRIIACP